MIWGSFVRLAGRLSLFGLIIAAAPKQATQTAVFSQAAGVIADPILYRGEQIVFDLPELRGIGPIRHLSVSARRQDGGHNALTTYGDSEGRATGVLCAEGLPPEAHLKVRITTDSGTWVKWISAIREDDDSPSNAVAEPWPGINNPEQRCACTSCGDNCAEYTSSYASQDYGVITNDGTTVTSLALNHFDSRMLGFDLTLYHQSAVHYGGPNGESFSNSYNMYIVRTGEESGLIVTPNLHVYPISRSGFRTNAAPIQLWAPPEGFFSRLELDTSLNRWTLIHHRGCSRGARIDYEEIRLMRWEWEELLDLVRAQRAILNILEKRGCDPNLGARELLRMELESFERLLARLMRRSGNES